MTMPRIVMAASAAAFAAACATTPGEAPPPPMTNGQVERGCDVSELRYLVGQPVDEIDLDSLPSPRRVIPHGMAVTMEYVEGRLNLDLDPDRRVIRVWCG